jgi:radical SAM protein with 4Fe4S-binding SPASM domain
MSRDASGDYALVCPPPAERARPRRGAEEHHFLETALANRLVRRLLGALAEPRETAEGRRSLFEGLCAHYHDTRLEGLERVKWMVPGAAIDLALRLARADAGSIERELFHHPPTVRTLTVTARSLARYGLTAPQRYVAPLLVVWNITDLCNLSCRHCYQDAGAKRSRRELSRAEKLAAVDQMAAGTLPLLAIAGGEPLACPDLLPVIERAASHAIHVSIASNGTLVTEAAARRLKAAGARYIEISVDSPIAAEHDGFRGQQGSWARAVAGIRNAVEAGLDVGLAACLTSTTAGRLDELIGLAERLGCTTFSHFNFIPVGRGRTILEQDLDPHERERVLVRLTDHLQARSDRLRIISTAPQLARTYLMHAPTDGVFAQGHAGRAAGRAARVLARYIGGCGAGRCYCAIEPDGTVTPCVYMRSAPVGSLRDRSLADIWHNDLFALLSDRSKRTGACATCGYRAACGGCRARALIYTGDPTASDPGCVRNLALWRALRDRAAADARAEADRPSTGECEAPWPTPLVPVG